MDYFNVPIVLNNRNRLTTTRNLANKLTELGYTQVVILDNDSSYPPLLEWYDDPTNPYRVVRLSINQGQLAIYNSGLINEWPVGSWVGYSDSDIELNPNTPRNFIEILCGMGEKYNENKVGLALRINDLPLNNEHQVHTKNWESRYWTPEIEPDVYKGELDTTFGVIRVGIPFSYPAIRIGGNLTARHLPWYLDWNNLDEEEQYFIDNCSPVSTYKRTYDQWKLAKMNVI